jgi:DNA helicase IV
VRREEAPDVARLKADTRLADVVQRAVELAVQPAPEELVLYVDGHFVSVREREVAAFLAEVDVPFAPARDRFRMALLRRFYERYGELLGAGALRSFDDIERALRRDGFLVKYLDRVLALPRAEKLVGRLLTSQRALHEAADGILDVKEQRLLLRDRPKRAADLRWSEHDLPLIDEARILVDGPPRAYGHVIVDEAQDLSPMQLLTISRRAVDGSLTILGDVAQATGPVVYRGWQELEPYLPDAAEMTIEELRHAYRVPAEIMDLALPLLDRIAPDVEPPLAYRQGGEPPRILRVEAAELLDAAVQAAAEHDGLVAVIAPRSLAEAGADVDAFDEASIPVLTPRQAKGLEFDHVVVVEPAAIAEDGEQGLRELYVALTRPTKTLVVVHARPLPDSLGSA